MSSSTAPTTATLPATTERRIAYATTLAPLTAGILAPFLNHDTAIAVDLAYLAPAALTTASVMDWIPHTTYQQLPAGDILHRHRLPAFLSTLATGVALGMGTFTGSQGTDALLAGILNPLTAQGIVSLGWWATVALVPIKLRRILTSRKHHTPHATAHNTTPAKPTTPPLPQTPEQQILHAWGQHISHPDNGSHRGQTLRLRTISAYRWQGTITAPTGTTVTVTKDAISSVYRVPTEWITLRTGAHAGEANITVNLQPPADLDTSTLAGAWKKWAARNGGIMAGTHLEDTQPDPNTGGEVARVVADDTLDALPTPNMRDLVGALRTNHLLLSYEPTTNPRTAVIRLMKENPLRAGTPFPGPKTLLPSEGGYFRIGRAVSGRPLRAQLLDPKLGARHLFVSGVTGSGKGGVLQLIALAAHLSGAVIIYADPKGSSNPAIEKMAAYTGLGEDGAMGALLLAEALVNHRIDLTGQLKQKNFNPDVMPHVVFILDEASTLLGEKAAHRKRAIRAVAHIAKKGRSLGVSEVLANQLLQLAELGGDSAIRDNIVGSGGVIMLRSDSSQRHLVDLPPGMESVNPGDIPATWTGDDNGTLVYTDDVHIQDPESTFGLGYFMTTDGICAMGRTYNLEDATEYIDENNVTEPFDWPAWENRHDLVASLLAEGDDAADLDGTSTLFSTADVTPKKPASAKEKILSTLQNLADPLGIDTIYTHKDDIGRLAGVEGQTLANTLSQLTKTNEIHRGPDAGTYGLGPTPTTDTAE
ncbi:type IV secretory system conjugative DNA transfer family protein [Streptomyces sp. MB22_4]|uniref:type IV secretory system conjugative DNA transfer family protein n=1 Tax=Streptomyces sp. MB22_4 TaxID=3383120 RepID=UPI0039A114AB